MTKLHLLTCYAAALRAEHFHYAAALAELYRREFGEGMPK